MDDGIELVRSWIGKPMVVMDHVIMVERGLWTNFCVAIEDSNALYWSYPEASQQTDSVIAPPMMLPSWGIELEWAPDQDRPPRRTLELHFMVKESLGYPHALVTEVEMELHEPLRAGDSVRAEQVLRSVSEQRKSRLGVGRNWTIDVRYTKQDGLLAGVQTLHFLAYHSEKSA